MTILHALRTSPVAVMLGLLLGLLCAITGPLAADMAVDAYNERNPPWLGLDATIIGQSADAVQIRITGNRTRSDSCRYVRAGAQAYGFGDGWDAHLKRIDNEMGNRTRPAGQQLVGDYDVRPVQRARVVEIRVKFLCAGRPFTQVLARVPMEAPK